MITKTWAEAYEFPIDDYLDTNPDQKIHGQPLKYLSWNKCLLLLHKQGAENVEFIPMFNENGHSIFTFQHGAMIEPAGGKRAFDPYAPEVHVKVVVDDKQGIFSYPLINGLEVITMGKINQQLINSARQRAFVKGVGILTGYGLKNWEKEESEKEREKSYTDVLMELYAAALRKNGGENELLRKLNMNKRQMDGFMEMVKKLPAFEVLLRGSFK